MSVEVEADASAAAIARQVISQEEAMLASPPADEHEQRTEELAAPTDDLPLAEVVRRGGTATLATLFALNLFDEFDRAAFGVLGPDMQRSLGLSDGALALAGVMGGFVVVLAGIPIGYLGDRTSRTRLIGLFSLAWAAFALLTGLVRSGFQLALARVLSGVGKSNEGPLHKPVLADQYPLAGRSRVFAIHGAASPAGNVLAPVIAGVVATAAGGSSGWRWAFFLSAIPGAIAGVIALGLRDPERGRNEAEALDVRTVDDEPRVPLSAAFARLKKVETFRYAMAGLGALGFGLFTAPIFVNLVLERTYGLDAAARGVVGSIVAVGSLLGSIAGGVYGDRLLQRSPETAMRLAGAAVAAIGPSMALSVAMPNAVAHTVVGFVSSALISAAFVPVTAVFSAAIPARLRSVGFALVGVYLSLIGGIGGAIIGGILSGAFGPRLAIVLLVPPATLVGGGVIALGARHVRGDIARAQSDLREAQAASERRAAGAECPLLEVRGLDFSYGSVQVLFGVNLEVRRGEVLALLGTNGAGKSTVLRTISGLSLADRGIIRFDGRDITLSPATDRVRAGIVQMQGGKAVFPGLTVRENLAVGTHLFAGDDARVEAALARVLALFPRLAERLDQDARSLSGGEQQMLALAKALLLDPELLIIDELSLGLAPVVVAEMLEVIERLRADGVTMIVVEQSVNVALAITDRAVFMEKGQVRFEGAAGELRERDDLVRAVFLGAEGG